jgi:xanthine dehydrogenase YagR molybdenum-binding subunit
VTIGQPLPRPDGRAKVTGAARYAADHFVPGLVHGVLVGAPVPSGRVKSIETASAARAPGVVRVLTAADMPRFGEAPMPPAAISAWAMQGDVIRYEGEAIAIVLAETLEEAQHAASLVKPIIERTPFVAQGEGEFIAPTGAGAAVAEFVKGDPGPAIAAAPVKVEVEYSQQARHHNPMEPSATLAFWEGDRLTIYDATQYVTGVQTTMASLFGIEPAQIRVIAQHTGGGFGCKGWVWPHQPLTVAAARIIGRPVRIALTRGQMYATVGYQPYIRQKMTLAADENGALACVRHEGFNSSALADEWTELVTNASKGLYATPALHTTQRIERVNVNLPTALRAPVEGPGTWALGSAMDELAHATGVDPLELRIRNHADVDPASGKPWSSKKLLEAYETGAKMFGWRERSREPVRDGDWLVGSGMATCTMGNFRHPGEARVRLKSDATAVIEASTQDIGTGTLTIFPQIAADVLGLSIEDVTLVMGDSSLPQGGPTYGSSATMGAGSAILRAAEDVRRKLARLANLRPDDAEMVTGSIRRSGATDGISIAEAMHEAGVSELVGEGRFALPDNAPFNADGEGTPYAMRTFGAVFVEVGVDPELGLLRLRRAVGSYSAGRIINPRTAKAQMTGGIIWGWGKAAMEQSQYEPKLGRWLSKNLAGVAIPVHADIPSDLQVHFVDEFDEHASPLGAKGIGELGATGVAAAVANAVFHATGKRIRDLPITPDKLIAA